MWGDDKNDDGNEGVGAMIADGVVGIMGMFTDEQICYHCLGDS